MPRQRKSTSSPFPDTVCTFITSSQCKDEFFKCSKCPKKGRKSCSMKACFTCCLDKNCEGHREQYFRLSIVEGNHSLQKLARKQRASAVKNGAFRDSAFHFLGETINVWNLREYMKNPKWRDESIRKSRRYVRDSDQIICNIRSCGGKRKEDGDRKSIVGNRRTRFKAIMEELHKKSLDPLK